MATMTNIKRLEAALDALHGEEVNAVDKQRIVLAFVQKHRADGEKLTLEERAGVVLNVLWQEVASTTLGEEARAAMATAQATIFQRGIGK